MGRNLPIGRTPQELTSQHNSGLPETIVCTCTPLTCVALSLDLHAMITVAPVLAIHLAVWYPTPVIQGFEINQFL